MALANVAELFYKLGLKILIVDFDIGGSRIESYFPKIKEGALERVGLLDLIIQYKEVMLRQKIDEQNYNDYFKRPIEIAIDIYSDEATKGKLYLITRGKQSTEYIENYGETATKIDWKDFYDYWAGEHYFDWLRQQFESMADIVFINSPSGNTVMSKICSYQFADAIVMLCELHENSIERTYETVKEFSSPIVLAKRCNRPLDIIVVPTKVEGSELAILDEMHKLFKSKFDAFIPKSFENDSDLLWKLKIPYIPIYSHKCIVAVRDDRPSSLNMCRSFENLARTLADLSPVKPFDKNGNKIHLTEKENKKSKSEIEVFALQATINSINKNSLQNNNTDDELIKEAAKIETHCVLNQIDDDWDDQIEPVDDETEARFIQLWEMRNLEKNAFLKRMHEEALLEDQELEHSFEVERELQDQIDIEAFEKELDSNLPQIDENVINDQTELISNEIDRNAILQEEKAASEQREFLVRMEEDARNEDQELTYSLKERTSQGRNEI